MKQFLINRNDFSHGRLLLPAPDVIDTSLLCDCFSAEPAESAEKLLCVS